MECQLTAKQLHEALTDLCNQGLPDPETFSLGIAEYIGLSADEVETHQYDSCIDDSCDDGINEYVMKDCYDATIRGEKFRIRIYYGDVDQVVGYVDVQRD